MFNIDITRALVIGTLGLTVASGCSKDDKEAGPPAAKPVAAEALDLGTINAAVPEGMTITFTTATIDDELEAVVPEGWEASKFIPGSYAPPNGANLGFFTKYKVGSNCDGACEPKDWAPIVEKVEFGRLEGATILEDEELDNGRLVIAKTDERVRVIAAWWKPDARQYFYCRAELHDKATAAVDAFEKACRNTKVVRW